MGRIQVHKALESDPEVYDKEAMMGTVSEMLVWLLLLPAAVNIVFPLLMLSSWLIFRGIRLVLALFMIHPLRSAPQTV